MSADWSNNNVDLVISLMEKVRYKNMKKEGYSRPGLFGSMNYYNNSGHKVGESRPGMTVMRGYCRKCICFHYE